MNYQVGSAFDVVCISHLRWNFVWQRPQHILQRLSKRHNVLFVEEPFIDSSLLEPEFVAEQVLPNVTVGRLCVPVLDSRDWIGFDSDSPWQERYEAELKAYLAGWTERPIALWLYTPLAAGFIKALDPELVVYDVMDELANFLGAPPEIVLAERRLLRRADIVFTGGVSIYRSKLPHNAKTYLFPSGVDQQHFLTARKRSTAVPEDLDCLPHPRIGYYGVIDERVDAELLREMAASRPEWHFVMIGPVVKISPSSLPAAPNISYLGKREYAELPAYLKGFDVAMMPFALNEATQYISPTKTLEYMAGGKSIVSTRVNDVVELYGEVVRLADGHEEFARQCEAALIESAGEREARRLKSEALLAEHEWDDIAGRMDEILVEAMRAPVSVSS